MAVHTDTHHNQHHDHNRCHQNSKCIVGNFESLTWWKFSVRGQFPSYRLPLKSFGLRLNLPSTSQNHNIIITNDFSKSA